MPSRGKKKTTMAKLNRESRLRDRKAEKEARKTARRHAATFGPPDAVDGTEPGEAEGLVEPSGVDGGEVAERVPADG